MEITTVEKPSEKVFLDIIGPFTMTNKGQYIIIHDDLTKFSVVFLLMTYDTNSVAKTFVEVF